VAALIVWSSWLTLMTGANLATPLYAVYAERFGFSSLVLTAVFATYAFVLVPSLILFGRLSDRFGRRPVLFAGLLTASVGLGLFAAAQSVSWLFGARAVQGLAVGMISGAATAALVELDPDGDRRRALGPLFAGVLAEWAPYPRQLCFLIALAATLVAAGVVLAIGEERRRDRERWRIEWPRVPPGLRMYFARVSLTAATVWATVALYLSIVPSYARVSLHTQNLALIALIATAALLASCVAQVAARRIAIDRRRQQACGLLLLMLGLAALVAGAPFHSLAAFLGGAVAAGTGHGFAYLNAQEELNDLAPAERRGEVTAAFISCIYFLVATSVISTGVFDRILSLTVAVTIVAAALMVVAACATAWQLLRQMPPMPALPASAHEGSKRERPVRNHHGARSAPDFER
jgi:MFS family permease